ncbi:MAG: NADH-quinone oxidoreductase subunit M [Chitinophagales bacterium]|nr:NADH-quinone oxidoreductase subunit M [Chitinophagales bacterium]
MTALLILVAPFILLLSILLAPVSKSSRIALIGSLVILALIILALVEFYKSDFLSLSKDVTWIPSLGISFNIGIDGISLILVLLTGILYPFIIATTLGNKVKDPKAFYSLMILMQFGLVGVFISKDAFLFYVFYELTLVPIYFICAIWGAKNSIPVTLKFFIYTLAGSLLMLVAILYLYFKTPGTHTFDIASFYTLQLSSTEQSWIFWAFFIAFAIKIPVFPFHTWQPDTYTVSPAAGTMLLAGIMLKMGIYGLIRFVLPIVPNAVLEWSNLSIALCIIGIIYASVIALRQNDLKTLIAYSSIAHVGLITAGVLSVNVNGVQGAMIQMFNHGVNVIALLFMVDLIEQKYGTRLLSELSGVAGQMKKVSVFFIIVLLGSVGLPLTNGFIGEFLLLMGIYFYNPWAAAFAGLTLILSACYMLRLYKNVFLGEVAPASGTYQDFSVMNGWILVSLCLLVIATGIYPAMLLSVSSTAVQHILEVFATHQSALSTL